MDTRIIRKEEVEILFLETFNITEREEVLNVLKIIGKMVILDTESLYEAYDLLYYKKLKLKYVKLAVKNNLLIEYKKNYGTEQEEDKYFYTLKSGGKFALDLAGEIKFDHNLRFNRNMYNKLIEFNYDVIENCDTFWRFWGMDQETYMCKIKELIADKSICKDHFGEYTSAIHPKYS